jgi:uncharacterized protein
MMLLMNDFLGQGLAFPLDVHAGQLQWSAGSEDIKQAIVIILQTMPGERVMVPNFGCRLGELIFAADNGATRSLAESYTKQALDKWEPRIDVQQVTASMDADDRSRLLVSIDYVVRDTNRPENLVYPFYLK